MKKNIEIKIFYKAISDTKPMTHKRDCFNTEIYNGEFYYIYLKLNNRNLNF
jgi:hypothetical protein